MRVQGLPAAGYYGLMSVERPVSGLDPKLSILNRVRRFSLYEGGQRIGQYNVERLEILAPSGCSTELVGVGRAPG